MRKFKLYHSQIGISQSSGNLEKILEIRMIYSGVFTLFFLRSRFTYEVGWLAKPHHGDPQYQYYGWNFWAKEDVDIYRSRVGKCVKNPEIVFDLICPLCTNKLECLCENFSCCNPKWEGGENDSTF